MNKSDITFENLEHSFLSLGYEFNTNNLGINLGAIRSKNMYVNNFDDFLFLAYYENGEKKLKIYTEFTTDPGLYYMQTKLLNPLGCGILKKGQYKNMFKLGLHKGKYPALVQVNEVSLYRDRTLDNYMNFDENTLQTGLFGINLHHGYDSVHVGTNSAACQVLKKETQLNEVLDEYKRYAELYNPFLTYTLFEESDLNFK